jgi:glycosyltransferase involved in cell wall biosynthesis
MKRVLRILGTRGIPASHGGFETFAEQLALYLVGKGWRVIVYCQEDGAGPMVEDTWRGIERVRFAVDAVGAKGTIVFDWRATAHAARHRDLCLTLGYNTALFCVLLRLKGVPNLINMDGIEWSRAKWGPLAKTWFWLNERAGCWLGNHLVADHPHIQAHLQTRVAASKITTIAYGGEPVTAAPVEPVLALGLQPGGYLTVIARAEPENSILELVQGFSTKPRGQQLAVLGHYDPTNGYHRAVKNAASGEVKFIGAIYDKAVVSALRFHSTAYVHGHQVGGTNPSLVEALGASNPVIAHDNRFNRWVAGDGACYFNGAASMSDQLDELLSNPGRLAQLRAHGQRRFEAMFTWGKILGDYEALLDHYLPGKAHDFSRADCDAPIESRPALHERSPMQLPSGRGCDGPTP